MLVYGVYGVAFLGGVLTIVSPCILPVLPFVFSRAGRSFPRSGLPLLAGMALTFVVLATMTTVAGGWVIRANQIGRVGAMAIFAILGLALVVPRLADVLARPLVRLGAMVPRHDGEMTGPGGSMLLGVSTGLLWAPCAGPILGLILTGGALEGASWHTAWLLLSFAAGAASMLALVLLAGNRVVRALKRSFGVEAWVRRGVGVAALVGVTAIASGWDTGVLTRISLASTSSLEQRLVDRVRPVAAAQTATNERRFPSLAGAVAWLNSPPLTAPGLRGRIVLIDFWTYSCINCLRAVPYVQAWSDKYRSSGLVVIGVHTPEFAFERDIGNVTRAVRDLRLTYPIAIDSGYAIWKAFANEYWPAHYVIDAEGTVRYHHFGEGQYEETEKVIQQLLRERDAKAAVDDLVQVVATGAQAAASVRDARSPETYVGHERMANFASPQSVRRNEPTRYTAPSTSQVNQWGLVGQWTVREEHALLMSAPGKILFRFHARDLHLVLGPGVSGRAIRFRVRLDGSVPFENRGVDVSADGTGLVTGHRLYQLIRQKTPIEDRTFEIEFLDPGVEVFSFTFG